MGIPVKLPDAREMIEQCLFAKIVPYLKGSPASGKSAIVHQIAKDFNLKLIDLRLASRLPEDFTGFPRIYEELNKAGYVPMTTFPVVGDKLPINPVTGKKYSGWMIFLDEMPLADKDVLKAIYQLILDRQVGEFDLHERVAIVAAGNLATDNAMADGIDNTAIQSRMVHMEVKVDLESWLSWARTNGIDHRITSFINFRPELLFKFDPDHDDETFASPRTWEFASRLIKPKEKLSSLDKILLSGTVSEGVAREFVAYTQIHNDLPTIHQLIARPNSVDVPREPSILWAMTGLIGHHASSDNIDQLMQYIGRIAKEFQFITMREIFLRTPVIKKSDAVQDWLLENAHELF